jgi:hypothetical protein
VHLQALRVLPMTTGDDMMRPQRRFSGTPGKRQNPSGASLTEKIVSASTLEADLENLSKALANKPLKPPRKRA